MELELLPKNAALPSIKKKNTDFGNSVVKFIHHLTFSHNLESAPLQKHII